MLQTLHYYSDKIYVRLERRHIAMFRFLLEGHDNLGLMTVIDSRVAWLKLIFTGDQRDEILRFLEGIKQKLQLEIFSGCK